MTEKVEPETEYVQLGLEDIPHFWLPNGAPCFIADREDICDQVEGIGFQIYYLIANEEVVKTTSSNTSKPNNANTGYSYQSNSYTGKLMKVVKSIVGRSVSASEEDFGKNILSFKSEAEYHMPAIPHTMVKKLDEFFRLVHAQHGTESIVILTFDPTKNDSSGWGILVPEQTNTAAHCKYDPDSVAVLKEDHVLIVGSVHSHPEMSAYASGTDHEDQADFDGLHITYGWQSSVANGMTQYHAELQMGGSNFILDISDVFESFELVKEPDPEVVEWTEKVKKVPAPALGAYPTTQYGTTYYNSGTTPTVHPGITNYNYSGYDTTRFVQKRIQKIPLEILDAIPYNAVLVAEVDTSDNGRMICPSCGLSLFKNEIYLGSSCPSCDLPLVAMNTDINSIIKSVNGYQGKRNRTFASPYYLWSKNNGGSKPHTILLIKAPAELEPAVRGDDNLKEDIYDKPKVATLDDDDSDLQIDLRKEYEEKLFQAYDNGEIDEHPDLNFELEYWATRTWCCERDVALGDLSVCGCACTVVEEDAIEYDAFCNTNSLNVYAPTGDCNTCVFFYTAACPSYREGVVSYKKSCDKPTDVILSCIEEHINLTGCIKWDRFPDLESQIETNIEDRSYDNTY